jgi:hypothetical protein
VTSNVDNNLNQQNVVGVANMGKEEKERKPK